MKKKDKVRESRGCHGGGGSKNDVMMLKELGPFTLDKEVYEEAYVGKESRIESKGRRGHLWLIIMTTLGIPIPWDIRICMGDVCVYVSKEIMWKIVCMYGYMHLAGGDGPSFSNDFFFPPKEYMI